MKDYIVWRKTKFIKCEWQRFFLNDIVFEVKKKFECYSGVRGLRAVLALGLIKSTIQNQNMNIVFQYITLNSINGLNGCPQTFYLSFNILLFISCRIFHTSHEKFHPGNIWTRHIRISWSTCSYLKNILDWFFLNSLVEIL